MTRATKLTRAESSLTALQYDALKLASQPGGERLLSADKRTIDSLLRRKLVDEKGETGVYVATPRGRTVLAHYEAHIGRAKR